MEVAGTNPVGALMPGSARIPAPTEVPVMSATAPKRLPEDLQGLASGAGKGATGLGVGEPGLSKEGDAAEGLGF